VKGKEKKQVSAIVIVDDDPVYLTFWRRILTDIGVSNLRLTSDPREAMKMLKKSPCRLLISDIIMPHIKGYELARFVNETYPDCPIILTSGFSTDLSRFDLSNPRFHLLHKPYTDLKDLRNFLKHILNGDDTFEDISEDSFSENEDYPEVVEWKL